VLPTFFDGRTRLAREAYTTLRGHFRSKCLDPIRHNTRLAEAPAHRKTIFEYAPESNGATDYERVVEWLMSAPAAAGADRGAAEAQV
jgi:chromosome partitioning protein